MRHTQDILGARLTLANPPFTNLCSLLEQKSSYEQNAPQKKQDVKNYVICRGTMIETVLYHDKCIKEELLLGRF